MCCAVMQVAVRHFCQLGDVVAGLPCPGVLQGVWTCARHDHQQLVGQGAALVKLTDRVMCPIPQSLL